MNRLPVSLRLSTLCGVIATGTASAAAMTHAVPVLPSRSAAGAPSHGALNQPALIAVDSATATLEYWAVQRGGSKKPQQLPGSASPLFGLCGYASLVADGVMVIAAGRNLCTGISNSVLFYNVKTNTTRSLPDPYGIPSDIAIGRNSSLYVLNGINALSNVAYYPQGSGQPKELVCKKLQASFYIAADNEGDIFVQGIDTKNRNSVVEIPAGPGGPQSDHCTRLPLLDEGYADANGVAVDPKTDDLITVEDTGQCAPSIPVMSIYPKPYSHRSVKTTTLHNRAFCTSGPIRLNADSTIIFYHDEDLSTNGEIDASVYPGGGTLGVYKDPDDIYPQGFTTIPNTLPN